MRPQVAVLLAALSIAAAHPQPASAGSVGRAVSATAVGRLERGLLRPRLASVPCRSIPSKCAGLAREAAVARILRQRYPSERLQSETFLVNRSGRPAIDPKTRTARRIDFVMFSGGRVSRRFEITSQLADKTPQLAKERRMLTLPRNGVRRTGSLFVRNRGSGRLVPVSAEPSEVIRFH